MKKNIEDLVANLKKHNQGRPPKLSVRKKEEHITTNQALARRVKTFAQKE